MKRKLIITAIVLLALLVCAALYLAVPYQTTIHTIRQLRVRYAQTQRGMTVAQVQALMAHPGGRASQDWFPAWDDDRLPPAESQRITSALQYSFSSSYLIVPVSFEFTFDRDRRLVGRHIYD